MDDANGGIESVLINIGGLSLREVAELEETALGEALARRLDEAAASGPKVARFDSVMSPVGAQATASPSGVRGA
ncbi:FxSxx-COOH cyclophane-containing RiPP peptide [Thermomonospora cellulosilytica]|uniref:FXSXX-COOH protein n=1 Tax=Thermomonospora cellulosilytica TaxID=1411118 RepID=A0A7W3MYR4_9ACTN|nr:FxSxx-COOH cyclophane-containing RiPP peptide [Thermomonospora cellulosilytica]MBA9004374.1 FXSXX-COOH protein [Thermomonospora cellulosilytica]